MKTGRLYTQLPNSSFKYPLYKGHCLQKSKICYSILDSIHNIHKDLATTTCTNTLWASFYCVHPFFLLLSSSTRKLFINPSSVLTPYKFTMSESSRRNLLHRRATCTKSYNSQSSGPLICLGLLLYFLLSKYWFTFYFNCSLANEVIPIYHCSQPSFGLIWQSHVSATAGMCWVYAKLRKLTYASSSRHATNWEKSNTKQLTNNNK